MSQVRPSSGGADPSLRTRAAPGVARRRWGLALTAALLLALGAVTALAALSAVRAADELQATREALLRLRADDTSTQDRERGLNKAHAALDRADRHLDAPTVAVVAHLPVVGRSWRAERAVLSAAQATVAAAQAALARAPALHARGGAVDVAALQALGRDLDPATTRAEAALRGLRETPTSLTPPLVGNSVQSAERELALAVDGLRDAVAGVDLLAGLLGAEGPRTVLVALQNNAELRGTGGYVSTYATGRVTAGAVNLSPFRDVQEVSVPPHRARKVPAPPEFVEDYSPFLADTTLWRNWTMSPDIPASASVGAAVAAQLVGARPDVVLLLDVPAMAAIVRAGGGDIALPDGTLLSADELSEGLLVDTYARAGRSVADQDARRAALRGAADRAVATLLNQGLDGLDAVRLINELGRGRHLALWSERPQEQAALVRLGLAGDIAPSGDDLAHVSVNNLSANKLDYYVDRRVDIDVVVGRDGTDVTERVRLVNRAPEGLVPYVAGNVRPGVLRERVEFSVSARATVLALTDGEQPVKGDVRRGADRTRVATYVELGRGETIDLVLRYRVPCTGLRYRLELLPQPLARDATLQLSVRAREGESLADVDGAELVDGRVEEVGPWSQTREVTARLAAGAEPLTLLQRVRRFWDSPVTF